MRARCVKILVGAVNSNTSSKRRSSGLSVTNRRVRNKRNSAQVTIKINFHSLDDDILCKIFEFIHFKQLAQISCVSKAFNNRYCQNPQWKQLCLMTFTNVNGTYLHNDVNDPMDWKKIYVQRLKRIKSKKLNTFVKKILNRSSMNHTLPNTLKLLHPLNIEYVVYINDTCTHHDRHYHDRKKQWKQIRSFDICTVLKIQNTSSLSQFALEDIKDIKIVIKSPKLFESVQLCFDIDACQMKCIQNIENNKKNIIQIHSHQNIHFAAYDSDNIAFIVISLSHYQILSKIAPKLFRFDKLSYIGRENQNKRGFYGWKCQIMFRNMKNVYFNRQFHELIPSKCSAENGKDRYTQFKLIGDGEMNLEKMDSFPIYPWKSETFKGKELGVFEIDVVLLNDKQQIVFTKSMMVECVLIKDLYNFSDQCNHDKRYSFCYKNQTDHGIFNSLSGNIVVLDTFSQCCNLQNLNLYSDFTV